MNQIIQLCKTGLIFFTLFCLAFFSTANAQWYRVDKHANKGWKESRRWLNSASKVGVGLADLDKINALAGDGLSMAEDGIGGLEDFAEDLTDDTISELEALSEELVEEVMVAVIGDTKPSIQQTGLFLQELYTDRPDLAENAVNALLAMAETGQTTGSYNAYLAIKDAFPSFQTLIDDVTSRGHFNTSVLFATSVGSGAIVGGEYTVGLAIEPGVPYINLAAFHSYGGTVGVEFPGVGGGLLIGFAVADPSKLAGPSLNGNLSVGVGPVDVGASVEISLPKIKGTFPDYDLSPPEFSGFTVDVGMGAGIPARGSITIGAGYSSILQGSKVYFDPNAPKPDRVFGTDNDDILNGSGEQDFIYGYDGDDEIHGGNGSDVIEGGNGNDVIYGDGGHDHMYGDDGDDVFHSGDGKDVIKGGDGYDVVHFPGKKKNWTIKKKGDYWVLEKDSGSKKTRVYECELAVFKKGNTKNLE